MIAKRLLFVSLAGIKNKLTNFIYWQSNGKTNYKFLSIARRSVGGFQIDVDHSFF